MRVMTGGSQQEALPTTVVCCQLNLIPSELHSACLKLYCSVKLRATCVPCPPPHLYSCVEVIALACEPGVPLLLDDKHDVGRRSAGTHDSST
jgi:hypothetical protein